MIIAIVVLELIASYVLAVLIGVGNRGGAVVEAPVAVGLATAGLQLAIH